MSTGYGQAVATKVARRTQAERTEATTTALVDAARALFARDGFDATSLDAVAARAGVTKGAVYHHFAGKRQLFEAVFSREVERVATPLAAAYGRKKDPWDAFAARTTSASPSRRYSTGVARFCPLRLPTVSSTSTGAPANQRGSTRPPVIR
jgi:AcrR family transcriptional regulator